MKPAPSRAFLLGSEGKRALSGISSAVTIATRRRNGWPFVFPGICLAFAILLVAGSVALGVPDNCGPIFGFYLAALVFYLAVGMTHGFALLVSTIGAGAIAFYGGKAAVRIEAWIFVIALACAITYALLPHTHATYPNHCVMSV